VIEPPVGWRGRPRNMRTPRPRARTARTAPEVTFQCSTAVRVTGGSKTANAVVDRLPMMIGPAAEAAYTTVASRRAYCSHSCERNRWEDRKVDDVLMRWGCREAARDCGRLESAVQCSAGLRGPRRDRRAPRPHFGSLRSTRSDTARAGTMGVSPPAAKNPDRRGDCCGYRQRCILASQPIRNSTLSPHGGEVGECECIRPG